MTRQKIKGKRKLCTLYSSQQKNNRTVPVTCISSSSEIHDESLRQIARMKDQLEVTDAISLSDTSTMTSMVLHQCDALLVSLYSCPLKDIPKTCKLTCSGLSPLEVTDAISPPDTSTMTSMVIRQCEARLVSSYSCPLKDIPKTFKMTCSNLSPLRETIVPEEDDSIVMMCEGDETSFEGKCFFFTEVPCL
jgi:hypothetical protein